MTSHGRKWTLSKVRAGLGMRQRARRGRFAATPCSRMPVRMSSAALAFWAMLLVCSAVSARQLSETQSARAKSLGLKVKCMCGGCNDPAGACFHSGGAFSGPCDMALSEIKLIDQKVSNGESDDRILKDFVAQYGPTVLVDPPKAGFSLTAWIVPVLVPIVGLFGAWELARRWRKKHPALASATNPSIISPEMVARVQHDVERDEP